MESVYRTHDIHRVWSTSDTIGVILDDIGSLEDSLDGAGFDVELIVAEAVLPAFLVVN